jgi:hypothetical protein
MDRPADMSARRVCCFVIHYFAPNVAFSTRSDLRARSETWPAHANELAFKLRTMDRRMNTLIRHAEIAGVSSARLCRNQPTAQGALPDLLLDRVVRSYLSAGRRCLGRALIAFERSGGEGANPSTVQLWVVDWPARLQESTPKLNSFGRGRNGQCMENLGAQRG